MQHRVLICGGRGFGSFSLLPWAEDKRDTEARRALALAQQDLANRFLDKLKNKVEIECVIQGDAKGADRLGKLWAYSNDIKVLSFPANWNKHGKKAGILRNQDMLNEGRPTLVVAFPGGTGTQDMISRAKKAGIPVIEVPNVVTTKRN